MERTPADERIHASDLVGSVQRALRVLEVVAQSPDGITAKAVARRLDLALSTTYHLLNTLAAEGYVVHLERARGYGIGYEISHLYQFLRQKLGVSAAVDAGLLELHQQARAAAYYAVFRDGEVVIARVVDSDWAPRINPLDVGFDQAAHALACGKVMLASLSPGARQAYLSEHGLPALTPRTTTEPQVLERELARVAETGLAADVEEFQLGQACLGVPVVGVNRTVSGCVALSVPAAGFDAARPRLERHLRRAAERTSRALALTG